jgi:hypothetical protein
MIPAFDLNVALAWRQWMTENRMHAYILAAVCTGRISFPSLR